ncbi:MAG: hypothetical protein ACYCYO_21540 [Bacilli bacterium]
MSDNPIWPTGIYIPGQRTPLGEAKLVSLEAQLNGNTPRLACRIEIKWTTPLTSPPMKAQAVKYLESTTILNAVFQAEYQSFTIIETTVLGELDNPDSGIEISGPLFPNIIDMIESKRSSRDISLKFRLHFVYFRSGDWYDQLGNYAANKNEIRTVRATWTGITIAASTWAEQYLPMWSYNGPQYIELPPLPTFESHQSVNQHFQQGLHSLKQGSLRAVAASCLAALDAVAKSKSYSGFGAIPEANEWNHSGLPEMSAILTKLKNYLNRYRHDNTAKGGTAESVPNLTHEEADFFYTNSLFIARMMILHLPDNPER